MTTDLTAKTAAELRKPFPDATVGKLPRSTCRTCTDSPRKRCDTHTWVSNCSECKGSHTSATIHLDFVGHAAVTDRLLAVDPEWSWEPMALTPDGFPALDRSNNLWIKLTVCGVTRLGVGDGRSMKELIGDAIRNAAMRFGVALDLWSKDELEQVTTGAERLMAALHAPEQPAAPGGLAAVLGTDHQGDAVAPRPDATGAQAPSGDGGSVEREAGRTPSAAPPPESPLLDVKGKIARRMFAAINAAGISEADRLVEVSAIIGRTVTSSKEMTDADAEAVIATLEIQTKDGES